MVGAQVGAYRILSQLGSGGMGVVYLAQDSRLNRRVALKFIRTDVDRSADADARLVREARAASALDHPNVATIYEIGEWQGGHFIAMAWYEGETLAQRIARGPLPVEEAARLLTQVADGLARAHAANVVHRDLKPANIMITTDGVVKILDFGLAAYSSPDGSTEARLTQTGSTMGTLAYMAPEQASGDRVDARADIWALGVIAYEILAGRRPFTGAHPAAVLHAIQYETPDPLAGPPEAICAVVRKALRRNPDERPQTAAEFGSALRSWQTHTVSGTTAAANLRTLMRRPKVIVPAVLIVLAAAVMMTLGITRQRRAQWARDVALPEASRLADAERIVEAFDLVTRAKAILPGDAFAAALEDAVSTTVPVRSQPDGASVSYQDYQHPEAGWRALGVTPIAAAKIPAAYLRWKFEKPGFTTVEIARSMGVVPAIPQITAVDAVLTPLDETPPGMVFVPGGTEAFRLLIPGFDHLTFADAIGPFWLDQHEVTNAEFKKFVDAGAYRRQEFWVEPFIDGGRDIPWASAIGRFVDSTGRPGPSTWIQAEYPPGEGDVPVSGVSWYEAAAYAKFAGKQLPTMSHWAHAADPRAARWVTPFSNFGGKGPLRGGARGVVNPSGTFDMAGNVKEWVATDAGDGRRYILGGGWDDPMYAFNDPDARSPFDRTRTFGFRCVVYAKPPAPAFLARLPFLTRDYRRERPVSDAVFQIYRRLYTYDPQPLGASVSAGAEETADWRREDVTIATAYGADRMRVFLFLPTRASPPYQTVVVVPGANALRAGGIDQFPRDTIDFLVKSGRAVAVPQLLGAFGRDTGLRDSTANASATYRDHVIAWVKDVSRTVDYLVTRPDLSTARLGFVGFSWGGRLGSIIPALEARIRLQVLVNGGFSLQTPQPEVDQLNFASRVTIPTLMLNGANDFYFPVESSQRPMFEVIGTPSSQKDRRLYEGGHNIPRVEMIKETLAWLDRFQGLPAGR